jgi:RNA polymerase sigma-70 factor (ECF subfamily)
MDRAALEDFRRDPSAVRRCFGRAGGLVYAVAHRVLGRPDLAEEATQQTFVRGKQPIARSAPHPGPWLATIAKRAALDIHRREARTTSADDVAANHRAPVTLPPEPDTLDSVWQVRRAIETLTPDEAAIVRLQHLHGITHTEIAATLGIAVGTVKSRSHRAHTKLAALLGHLREPAS